MVDESSGGTPGATPARRRRALTALTRFQLLLVALLLVATGAAAFAALEVSRDHLEEQEHEQMALVEAALGRQVIQAQDAVLGVRGLFAADAEVNQDAFGRFSESSIGRGGLQALFAAEPVRDRDRAAFERRTGTAIKAVSLLPRPSLTTQGRRDSTTRRPCWRRRPR